MPQKGLAIRSCLSDPSQFCSEMVRKWLADRGHPKRVAENITLDNEVAFDCGDVLGGCRAGNTGRSQQDGAVLKSALGYFHDSIGVRDDDLNPTWTRQTPEAALPVEQATIGRVLTDLAVGEIRLTDVRKNDGLLIVKVVNRRSEER